MAFGDVLEKNISLLYKAKKKRSGDDAFWIILRNLAVQDIKSLYPGEVDSVFAVPIYYDILLKYSNNFSEDFNTLLDSNSQERFRVINRNMFTSNAFHPDGLANQPGIIATRILNEQGKGCRIVYKWGGN